MLAVDVFLDVPFINGIAEKAPEEAIKGDQDQRFQLSSGNDLIDLKGSEGIGTFLQGLNFGSVGKQKNRKKKHYQQGTDGKTNDCNLGHSAV